MMSSKASTEIFGTALGFCARCGTTLPLPGVEDYVKCKLCHLRIDVTEFDGKEIVTTKEFNDPATLMGGQEEADRALNGPTADRKCTKCGHPEMIYTTRQTRSADEGQTVFFTCPECRFQEIEYS